MLKKFAALGAALLTLTATAAARAEDKPVWTGPFGGTFNAGFAVTSDYSYRGLSQTQRGVAGQATFGYETPSLNANIPLTAYLQAWGSNVNFPGTGAAAEIDTTAGVRYKALGDKLVFDASFMRYNYPGGASASNLDFNEYGFLLSYDFDVVQLTGGVHYSPNFFGASGIAWYKQLLATVPLNFIKVNDNLSFKLFGSVGSQYVEKNTLYGIPNNDYWDWQLGITMTAFTIDFSIAYTDTNIDVPGCAGTYNCEARAIFTIGKTF